MTSFKCPQCGGWAFGTDVRDGRIECHSDRTGMHLSMTQEEFDAGLAFGKRDKPCGWKGTWEDIQQQ